MSTILLEALATERHALLQQIKECNQRLDQITLETSRMLESAARWD